MRPEKWVDIRRSCRVLHYCELFSLYSGDQLRPVGQPRWCPEGCTGNAKPEWATVGTNNKGQLGSALFTPIMILNSNSTIQLPFSLDSVAVTEPLSLFLCSLQAQAFAHAIPRKSLSPLGEPSLLLCLSTAASSCKAEAMQIKKEGSGLSSLIHSSIR